MNLTGQIGEVVGQSAGITRLMFDLKVTADFDAGSGQTATVLNSVVASYAYHGRHQRGVPDDAIFLGFGDVEWVNPQLVSGREAKWRVTLPLADHRLIQEIEHLRGGGDLALILRVRVGLVISNYAGNSQSYQFLHVTVGDPAAAAACCARRIPRSDWITVLKQLEYGDWYLIELPLRGVPRRSAWKQVLGHLTDAWDHFNNGEDAETIGSCYKAFEKLARDAGAEGPDQNGLEKLLKDIESKKREKLKHLLHRIADLFNLARHEHPEADRIQINHAEAEYALILTQATLAYLANALSVRRSHPVSRSETSK